MTAKTIYKTFSASDIESFKPAMKIGMLATINDEGLPHLTLLSSLQASSPTQLTFGQFTEGLSKGFIKRNPKTAFLIMTLQKEVSRGKATFTHTAKSGPEYEMYNNIPMFRYNAYFGVHTVYYLDLVEHYGKQNLPMGNIIQAAVKTMIARNLARRPAPRPVLNLWTQELMNKVDNLKFMAYISDDGYPLIIPVIQAQAASSERIIFSTSAYGDELAVIPEGVPMALFGMTLNMEDVLVRGTYRGIRSIGGFRCGVLDVDWVYNSMPPVPGQIYPPLELEPVTVFTTVPSS